AARAALARLPCARSHRTAQAPLRAARHGLSRQRACHRTHAMNADTGRLRRSRGRTDLDVIVVGAGAAGGALALALARDGFEVAVVEAREPAPWRADDDVDLRVVALAPDARE